MRPWVRRLGVPALFTALTAVMTWPQALVLSTHAVDHWDVFFNLWRLRWIAHALSASPLDLFNGNIFYPEIKVLAFSDAMLLEGLVAAPLFWVGLPPLLVHNLLLLGSLIASGIGMFVLSRHLTGSRIAAVIAGVIFAFAPYRFDHYMHLELQWTMWIPYAFWALQRTIETGQARYGALTGMLVALQMLSSIYYGLFLSILLAIVALLQLIPLRTRQLLMSIRSLAIGASIVASVAWVYSRPYVAASNRVGARSASDVATFSARPRSYLAATPGNLLYGNPFAGVPERRLFPGTLAALLALVGLLLVPPSTVAIVYLIGFVAAFELSLGMNGHLYPFMYNHFATFQALRAPARASVFCLMFLGVLAAYGYAALASYANASFRSVLAILCIGVILLEYWVAPLALVPYENSPPPLYAWLARQPVGIVAEFPMPLPFRFPGHDPRYAYMSTFHWMPLLNGYSGYYPPSYIHRLDIVKRFPDARAVSRLRSDNVRYLILHSGGYSPVEFERITKTLSIDFGFAQIGHFEDGWGEATVFGVR